MHNKRKKRKRERERSGWSKRDLKQLRDGKSYPPEACDAGHAEVLNDSGAWRLDLHK